MHFGAPLPSAKFRASRQALNFEVGHAVPTPNRRFAEGLLVVDVVSDHRDDPLSLEKLAGEPPRSWIGGQVCDQPSLQPPGA